MDALLARPLDLAGLTSPTQLQAIAAHAAELVDEARWLEGCALLAELSPDETHAALRARPAKYLHELHSMVMERAYAAMPVIDTVQFHVDQGQQAAAAQADYLVTASEMRRQCEAFRSNPGRFLPGARPSTGVAVIHRSHVVDGWIELDGEDLPWAYGSVGVSALSVFELASYVRAAPNVTRGVVVGTHVQPGITLPPELVFVSLAPLSAAPGPEVA
ncbi:hypothetical protein D8770_21760 [Methylobacterium sp. DB1607]|nr:hypothetical protein [Methylobacterium sp. DB1607]